MRHARRIGWVERGPRWAVVVLTLLFGTACGNKKVTPVFERPPATASTPKSEPSPEEPSEPTPVEEEVADASDEPEPANEEQNTKPPPRPRRRPHPAPPPEPPEPPPPPPSPSLGDPEVEADAVRQKLRRANELLSLVEGIGLSSAQKEQAEAARVFVSQSRTALQEGDVRRASVLSDKALILAQDLALSSR